MNGRWVVFLALFGNALISVAADDQTTPRQVEVFIHHQVRVLNTHIARATEGEVGVFWTTQKRNDLLIAAYAVVANEITNYSHFGCLCCATWPWALLTAR